MSEPIAVATAISAFMLVVLAIMATVQIRHTMQRRAERQAQKTLPVDEHFVIWLRQLQQLHAHLDDDEELRVVMAYSDTLARVGNLSHFHRLVHFQHRATLVALYHKRVQPLGPALYHFLLGYEH